MKNNTLKNNIKKAKLSNEVILTHKAIKSFSKNQLKALTSSLNFITNVFKFLEKKMAETIGDSASFRYQITSFDVKELARLEHQVYSNTIFFDLVDKIRLLKTIASSQALHDNALLSRCEAILNLIKSEDKNPDQAKVTVYDYIKDNPVDADKLNESEKEFVGSHQTVSTQKKAVLTQEEADEYVKNLLAQFIQESEKNNVLSSSQVLDKDNKVVSKSGFVDDASGFFKKKKKQRATKPVNLHTYFPSEFSLEYIKTHPIKYSFIHAKIKRVSSNGTPLKIKFSSES